jgi:Asp/Glu/hydantoin racemase
VTLLSDSYCILTTLPRSEYTTMSMEESISLEETNKIRISLGLKPLTDDKAPADSDQQAEANYSKLREKEAKERDAKSVVISSLEEPISSSYLPSYRKIQDKIAK